MAFKRDYSKTVDARLSDMFFNHEPASVSYVDDIEPDVSDSQVGKGMITVATEFLSSVRSLVYGFTGVSVDLTSVATPEDLVNDYLNRV